MSGGGDGSRVGCAARLSYCSCLVLEPTGLLCFSLNLPRSQGQPGGGLGYAPCRSSLCEQTLWGWEQIQSTDMQIAGHAHVWGLPEVRCIRNGRKSREGVALSSEPSPFRAGGCTDVQSNPWKLGGFCSNSKMPGSQRVNSQFLHHTLGQLTLASLVFPSIIQVAHSPQVNPGRRRLAGLQLHPGGNRGSGL